ncbi:beta-L-arabinofuranosidase domain-containing protein [Flavihumibacter sp. CACIAM 22H1]|uniref:glycoside hydrolase family 127 protein n=1 Tax=Flavihumibacter sp. CACIAM 22H1 TaxID=1812911 RepID=UPI0007A83E25|nr:beta-L-arabinofuranosidase domain-containing protein [Flavihumibacter sp. CACIAM 22H1]KYP16380.1 MAG: six-hairpin glycosidase [Flavihumibacter sp. CACIAM 22H1]
MLKKSLSIGVVLGLCGLNLTAQTAQRDYPIQPIPFTQVHFQDGFWAPKMEVNATVSIPYTLQKCRETGRIDNFLKAAGKLPVGKITEYPFDDTDVYKLIEGASYSLQTKPNPELEKTLDTLIGIIGDAQEPDGYLYTFRTMKPDTLHPWISPNRWEKDPDLSHELYNSGHLYEAAVAHYLATGKRNFLDIALKNADLLVRDFGPGKAAYFPGHQVVEMGLARLYRVTGKKEYIDLAKYFLDIRGNGTIQGAEYSQSHKMVTDQHEAVGHAVRAAYMYTGMADVAALTGNQEYISAINDIWKDVVEHKLYLTGGIGATGHGEAFGAAYQLPNMSAYAETCASIANVYWNSRMFLMNGDAQYIDVLERILYNGLLSGVSLSGDRFFYPNPLASMGQHQRSAWFGCACCISNMTRFMPSIPGYVYAKKENELYVNLYVASTSSVELPAGNLQLEQVTEYPWKGQVALLVNQAPAAAITLHLRIPGWAKQEALPGSLYAFIDTQRKPIRLLLNGKAVDYTMEKGYAVLNRSWKKGDRLELELPLEIEKVIANKQVKEDQNRFALQRGPLVYCIEGIDNKDNAANNIVIDRSAAVNARYEPQLLNGVIVLTAKGASTKRQLNSKALLRTEQTVKAIPYYSWNNRGAGEMQVWIPYEASAALPTPAPTIASKSKPSSSQKNPRMLRGLNDQFEPENSQDRNSVYLHWWPNENTTEWVEYKFDKTYQVSSSSFYWFDDGPFGGCRIPQSYTLLYEKAGKFVPVELEKMDPISKDGYNTIKFKPVTTTALRLEVKLPEKHSSGIHEWMVN